MGSSPLHQEGVEDRLDAEGCRQLQADGAAVDLFDGIDAPVAWCQCSTGVHLKGGGHRRQPHWLPHSVGQEYGSYATVPRSGAFKGSSAIPPNSSDLAQLSLDRWHHHFCLLAGEQRGLDSMSHHDNPVAELTRELWVYSTHGR